MNLKRIKYTGIFAIRKTGKFMRNTIRMARGGRRFRSHNILKAIRTERKQPIPTNQAYVDGWPTGNLEGSKEITLFKISK